MYLHPSHVWALKLLMEVPFSGRTNRKKGSRGMAESMYCLFPTGMLFSDSAHLCCFTCSYCWTFYTGFFHGFSGHGAWAGAPGRAASVLTSALQSVIPLPWQPCEARAAWEVDLCGGLEKVLDDAGWLNFLGPELYMDLKVISGISRTTRGV